ncbi:MAG: hypothetical protein IIZ38_00595 [Sphingomonas sp.]|uniref:hypothetical protein n=1 Tax=unclassified Sphingomonas TaxID=196159 RepID=UPI0024553013|nr:MULTISPECIES: hypothetical protein [unclassified Sphingomonas]MBQ1496788.1 hypothetical protein [Sphingomonas sp.]MDH4743437.1 hypothetical protein [Sphingomonas sp. CBMAI 2297]
MQRIGAGKIGGRALAALVALAILLCALPHGRFGLDLQVDANATHAVLDLGPISFRIAFDSGRACPKSNSCAGAA